MDPLSPSQTSNSDFSSLSRRRFLATATAGIAAAFLPSCSKESQFLRATGVAASSKRFTIDKIERTTVRLPYRAAPKRAMERELPHWRYSEICEVTLRSGATGIGETLLYYTWGVTSDDDVQRAEGQNAAEIMWDDSLGAGLQQALFDAVATTLGVPIHRLLGKQVHDKTPLSWWNIDMAAEDMADECAEAHKLGYMSYKTKGRPWFDLWDQVERAVQRVPDEFKIDMDYNDTLLTADRAIPILKEFERYPQIDIYESPIPQSDVAGNRRICDATRVQIAMHYGTPKPAIAVREQCCDGFVIGGGASRVMASGNFAGQAGMPFWLQLVGTGITAAYSLHFGAVLDQARWPAVNCHQLYQHDLLRKTIPLDKGFAKVPEAPGLGYELDRAALEKYRVEKPSERPDPPRLVVTSWPDGRRMYFRNKGVNFVLLPGIAGKIPFYERGVDTKLWADDGSAAWRQAYDKADAGPYLVTP